MAESAASVSGTTSPPTGQPPELLVNIVDKAQRSLNLLQLKFDRLRDRADSSLRELEVKIRATEKDNEMKSKRLAELRKQVQSSDHTTRERARSQSIVEASKKSGWLQFSVKKGAWKDRWCQLEGEWLMVYAKVQTFDKKEKVLQAIELVNGYIVTKIDELKEKYGVESEFSFLLHSSSGKEFAFTAASQELYKEWLDEIASSSTGADKLYFVNLPLKNINMRDTLQKIGWVDIKGPKDPLLTRRFVLLTSRGLVYGVKPPTDAQFASLKDKESDVEQEYVKGRLSMKGLDVFRLPTLVPISGAPEGITLNALLLTPSHRKSSVIFYLENETELAAWQTLMNMLVADAADVRNVYKQEFLMLRVKKSWKKQWVMLTDNALYYFDDKPYAEIPEDLEQTTMKARLSLAQATCKQTTVDDKPCFVVTGGDKELVFMPENSGSTDDWVSLTMRQITREAERWRSTGSFRKVDE